MPERFYEEMDEMFESLGIFFKDTDNKEEMKTAENFIVTFTPDNKPIVIK